MPVLHKYRDKGDYYVLTSIGNKIVTFHLSSDGHKKLKEAGINNGDKFGRGLLLDLYRTGDAYTGGSGPGELISQTNKRQPPLPFPDLPDDPEPESLFPCCAKCSSMDDLHFVEIKEPEHKATILCPACRSKKIADSSIPLPLVTRQLLTQILTIKDIQKVDKSVSAYRKFLEAEFESKWAALIKSKHEQKKLIDTANGRQKKLI